MQKNKTTCFEEDESRDSSVPICVGDFTLELGVVTIRFSGTVLRLSHKETRLLGLLLQHQGHYVSVPEILAHVWPSMSPQAETHTLPTHIYRVNKGLEEKAVAGVEIRFDRTKGYGLFFRS
jgi:DNA-binding response OmpR family regulator